MDGGGQIIRERPSGYELIRWRRLCSHSYWPPRRPDLMPRMFGFREGSQMHARHCKHLFSS